MKIYFIIDQNHIVFGRMCIVSTAVVFFFAFAFAFPFYRLIRSSHHVST